jgi:signal transduction histidine kinase
MLRSLRWRLVAAFGFVIGLTLLISGALTFWTTTRRFELLVTDESRKRAAQIAPLLEASYAYRGNWSGLTELLTTVSAAPTPHDFLHGNWVGGVDWWRVAGDVLNLDKEALSEQLKRSGSLAQVAEQRGVDPSRIIDAILEAEQAAVDEGLAKGELTSSQAADYMAVMQQEAAAYVKWQGAPDWYDIVAQNLGLSAKELDTALTSGQSILDLAQRRGLAPEQLVAGIVEAERSSLRTIEGLQESEITLKLAELSNQAWDFIDPTHLYSTQFRRGGARLTISPEGAYWLVSTFVSGDERLLIADSAGAVVYDSTNEMRQGEQLPAALLSQGVPLWDAGRQTQIGTAIIAAGPGYYDAQQASFLRGVSLSLVLSGVVAGIVALLVGLIVARRVTAPVTALTEATRHIADGQWTTRIPVQATDELGQMSAAFNKMAETLEQQNALRMRLVDDMSHELNTPLSVIQLELEALRDEMQTPAEAVEHVQREIELLRSLLSNLTLLAETDAGALQLNREPLDLAELTAGAVARWQPKADTAGIDVRLTVAPALPPVQADRLRLTQVLGNLLANALEHTPPGGRVEVQCRREDSRVVTIVKDTGDGISAADLPHVFDRFYRADRSRSRNTGGRGLGLAIVREIIELHGGRVWVESQPGAGSTFGYSLPL